MSGKVPVYVICLDSKWETRGSTVCDHFNKCTLISEVNRSPATVPSDFKLEDVAHPFAAATISKGWTRESVVQLSNPNQIGCTLSHINLWRTCLALQTSIIVAEDDAKPKMLTRRVTDVLNAPLSADVVLLQCSNFPFTSVEAEDYSMCKKVSRFWGTACYYLTPAGAVKLLRHALPVVMHVDAYIEACIFSGLQVYSVPGCNDQDHSDTTLGHGFSAVLHVTVVRQRMVMGLLLLLSLIIVTILVWRLYKKPK